MIRIAGATFVAIASSCLISCAARSGAGVSPAGPATDVCRNTHENLNAVLWMQQAVEYEIAAEGTYARALDLLRAGLLEARTDRSWSAAPEQQGGDYSQLPPAVVMDLDETVLDNGRFQGQQVLDNESEFDRTSWSAWVSLEQATAVPGAVEFILEARRHATVLFVTNRTAAEEPATRGNLRRLGLDVAEDEVLSAGERDSTGQTWSGARSDKSYRRRYLASRYRIVLLIGDDIGDFVAVSGKSIEQRRVTALQFRSYWADRWVMVPNPAYGSWERATYDRTLPDAERLAMKRRHVHGFDLP